jgi:hypothetical protein
MRVNIGEPGLDLRDAVRVGRGFRFGEQGCERSRSAARTKSITGVCPAGASWATVPMRAPGCRLTDPSSGVASPRISRNSVDLPVPLRPTSPMRVLAGRNSVA